MSNAIQRYPAVSGPVEGGQRGWPFAGSLTDISAVGYVEAEYLLAGTAERYTDVENSTSRRDGHWTAEANGEAGYTTRLLIYRPIEPEKFNGTVVLTWNNVTAGYDLFSAESREIFEGGFALACLTTQKVGIEGLPPVRQGLADWDPDRYGGLSIPSDDYSYDIFTQAARAVGPDRQSDVDPMAGLKVERVVAFGASQSAGRLCTYIDAIQPITGALDGFILAIYFGRGTPLEVGETVVNINDPSRTSEDNRLMGQNLVRDDTGVPVFVVNSELESISCHGVRQEDTDTFRYWESAGTCHVSQQVQETRQQLQARDGIKGRPAEPGINRIPMALLYDAVYFHMQRWLADGIQPPRQPMIEYAGDPAEIVRDEHGIATGGIRLPQVEVPIAINSAIPRAEGIIAYLDGSCDDFPVEKVKSLYKDKAAFLAQFEAAALKAVEAEVLRPRDVQPLLEEAAGNWDAIMT